MDSTELIEKLLDGPSTHFFAHVQAHSHNQFDQLSKEYQFSTFSADFKNFLKKRSQINVLQNPALILWFFLGGLCNLGDSGLMHKLGIPELYVKHHEGMIRVAFVKPLPNQQGIRLVFRTYWLAEPPVEVQLLPEHNTFTEDELTELVHAWNLDYFSIDGVEIDNKYFEITSKTNEFTAEQELEVFWSTQAIEGTRKTLRFIAGTKLTSDMYQKPHGDQTEKSFSVIRQNSKNQVTETMKHISNLQSGDMETVKLATSHLLHKFHGMYRHYRTLTPGEATTDSYVGYVTGIFALNYMKRYNILVTIHKFPISQYPFLSLLSLAKTVGAKLDINIPIIVDSVQNHELPDSLIVTMKSSGIREFLPSFDTDSKFAILGAINYDLEPPHQPHQVSIVEINEGFMPKLINTYKHIIEGRLTDNGEDFLNIELMHMLNRDVPQVKSSLISTFMFGQVLTLEQSVSGTSVASSSSSENELMEKAIFEYTDPVLWKEITTFLISHGSYLIALNIGKEEDRHELTEAFFDTKHNLFNLPEQEYTHVLHINILLSKMHGSCVTVKHLTLGALTAEFSIHDGQLHLLSDVNALALVKNLENKQFEDFSSQLTRALFDHKNFFSDIQHLKTLMKGVFNSKMVILTSLEKQVDSIIGIINRELPKESEEIFVSSLLKPTVPFSDEFLQTNRVLIIKLKTIENAGAGNVIHQIVDQTVLSFTADYFLHLDFLNNYDASDTTPVLCALIFNTDAQQNADLVHGAIFETGPNMKAMFPMLAKSVSEECRLRKSKREVSSSIRNNCGLTSLDVKELDLILKDEKGAYTINSEKLSSYLASKGENGVNIATLMGNVDDEKLTVTGDQKNEVLQLVKTAKMSTKLNSIAKLADTGSILLMGKDLIAQIWRGDYSGASATTSFVVGSMALGMTASAMEREAQKLGILGYKTRSSILYGIAPFVGKLASGYILYDWIQNMQKIRKNQDRSMAVAGLVADTTFLTVDSIDIGYHIAENFGLVEISSSAFGPIGSIVGGLVFIGTNIYSVYDRISRINEVVHLTAKEVAVESARAFLGLGSENSLEKLVERTERFNNLTQQANNFLSKNTYFKRCVFPTQSFNGKIWQDDADNTIDLDRRVPTEYVSRDKPTPPEGVKLLCFDSKSTIETILAESMPSELEHTHSQGYSSSVRIEEMVEGSYYVCQKSIGISNQVTRNENATLVELKHGNDVATGFPYSPNSFLIGNGVKNIVGGFKTDTFIMTGNRTLGIIIGGEGTAARDTLDLSQFGMNSTGCSIGLIRPLQYLKNNNETLFLRDIRRLITRKNKNDRVIVDCSTQHVVATGGKSSKFVREIINIPRRTCFYKLNIEVGNKVSLINDALLGIFHYFINRDATQVIIKMGLHSAAVHRLVFQRSLKSLEHIYTNNMTKLRKFSFQDGHFIAINNYQANCSYFFGDDVELRFHENKWPLKIHGYVTTKENPLDAIETYSNLAEKLHISFSAKSLVDNSTIFISHSNQILQHETERAYPNVLHNDPWHHTYIYGSIGENMYVINSAKAQLTNISETMIEPVFIKEPATSNFTRTIILKHLIDQLKAQLNCSIGLRISPQSRNLILHVFSQCSDYSDQNLTRIVLLNSIDTKSYEKIHVVTTVPMKIVQNTVNQRQFHLVPLPISLQEGDTFILLHPENVTENSEFNIPRKINDFEFFKNGQGALMLLEKYSADVPVDKLFFIILMKFEQNYSLYSNLKFKFENKLVDLATEHENLMHVDEKIQEYESKMKNEVDELSV